MSGFDQSHSGAFFNFNNLTSQQLNMLRQQNQMQQAVQMPQQQQPQPQPPPAAQPQMQQRNPMMPQLGSLPPGFNQQQLQAFMAQQQSQLAANGMLGNNQNPLMQIMRPQQIIQPQPPQQQMQQQPQHPMQPQQPQQHPQLQAQMGLQQPATSQPAHLQQQPQQTANMAGTPQLGGVSGPTPTFAQLSHAIEQAKKGNLTQEQMIQAMQAQQQAAQNQPAGARPSQPGQPMMNMPNTNGQNFANLQRTPQIQAAAQMMAGLQQIRPAGPQSTPTMGSQAFLQPSAPGQQQQQSQQQPQQPQQPNQVQSLPQVSLQGPGQINQQQVARAQTPQQMPGMQQNTQQQQQLMGQQPGQPGQQRPVAGRPEPTPETRNQQNPLNFLRLLHQRVTDIESKLNSDLSAEERQMVQQQHAEAKRLQSALLQRLNVQNAQQFAALMQQGQQGQQASNAQANQQQQQQPQQQAQQPQQVQQQPQPSQGVGVMGNNTPVQPHASPVIRPPNRPGSARPPQGQFGSPMLNQQTQNAPQIPPQQTPQMRPSPLMGAMNIAGQPGMSGLQGVPSLRPEQFMKALVDLMKKRGTPITSLPKVGGRELDLYRFYQIVQAHGGSEGAHQKGAWPAIAISLELAPLGSPQTQALGQALATEYRNYLAPFEETWQRAMQHQYQMSMAGAGLAQGQNAGQNNSQAPAFRPPSTPQMQSQQPNQLQGQQAGMMPPNQPQLQPQMQAQNAQPAVGPTQSSLAGFNPPQPPTLTAENLAKLGMTQDQFNKVFMSQQLNHWRQEQLQNQQRQMDPAFQSNQAGTNNMQGPGSNGIQQPPQAQQQQPHQPSQQQPGQPSAQQPLAWPNQQRPIMPQTSGAPSSQTQPASFGAGMPGQPLNTQQMQNQGQQPGQQQQQQHQSQMQNQSSQQQQPPAQTNATGSAQQPGQQGQMAGRPNNISQARFIAVSSEQLEQARAAMAKIDQELATQRPRLPIIQNIADDERDQILDQVQKLAPIQATVTALLPAFYAMNGNLEPAKRLKIMAFMYKDQYDLLPKKQCILRLADLDKLKMQMSRCISFVRSSNPELAQRIVTSLGEQTRAAQQNGAAPAVAPANANQAQVPNAMQAAQSAVPVAPAPVPAPAEAAGNQTQASELAPGMNTDGTFDAAAAMHGIKRGLRPENLKLPPNKRAKNTPGAGKATSPSGGLNESPKVAPSPAQPEDTPTPAGSTPAGKGGKRADKTTKSGKVTAKKGKGAAGTPTSSAAEPDKKFKTSADIMAEVKREMAEAERKRHEGGAGGDASATAASNAAANAKVDTANIKAEQEAEEKRKKDLELAGKDLAGLVESTWHELLATGNANNGLRGPNGVAADSWLLGAPSAGPSAHNGSDPKALQSLMSLLGQDSMLSGMLANGFNVPSKGLDAGQGNAGNGSSFLDGALDSLPSADADTGLDIDLFDFIEASAAGPDAFNDTDVDLSGVFGSGGLNAATQESEPPVETPELVASARLPGGSSNASTASNSTSNSLRAKMPGALGGNGLDFGSAGPSSTSPAEMSSCDEIDLDKSPFVHRMRLDRIGLTMAPAAPTSEGSKSTNEANQSTVKAPEETAINQVELGPGSQGIIAGSGDEWWDLDHFASTMGGGFGSDASADQPWAVLS
ncbi:related to GAL11 - subunit of the RNA polymerase II mediator complex [Ustilago sp. UG-2017b]|nr:related to GAL11 - subunit of the RNA polymerase II mediator complex [Ustilago sp. UG-2017b]